VWPDAGAEDVDAGHRVGVEGWAPGGRGGRGERGRRPTNSNYSGREGHAGVPGRRPPGLTLRGTMAQGTEGPQARESDRVGLPGLEPGTSSLSGCRSGRLGSDREPLTCRAVFPGLRLYPAFPFVAPASRGPDEGQPSERWHRLTAANQAVPNVLLRLRLPNQWGILVRRSVQGVQRVRQHPYLPVRAVASPVSTCRSGP
jgi:hypothetical protein